MKRLGWRVTVLIILAALVFLWLIKAPIMSSYLTKKMQVHVSVGSISVWPTQMKIANFKMKNPRGFKSHTAFSAKSILVSYQWKQLRDNPSIIDEILIDQVYLGIEFVNQMGTENNWTKIIQDMPSEKDNREVLIKRLVLTNMTVEIKGKGFAGVPQRQTFDRMEFENIDSTKGFPTQELISKIFGNAGLLQYIQNIPGKIIETLIPFGKCDEVKSRSE